MLKKYYTYQQLARAFDVGAVLRNSQNSLNGDITWTYGKSRFFLPRQRRTRTAVGVRESATRVTVHIDELKNRAAVPFVVHRINDTMKNAKAEIVTMKNGKVTKTIAPLELVTLRSSALKISVPSVSLSAAPRQKVTGKLGVLHMEKVKYFWSYKSDECLPLRGYEYS